MQDSSVARLHVTWRITEPRSLLGISFITFSAVSYLLDICKGEAAAASLVDCALYLTFFPKLVSGPIVLWKDFQPQIRACKKRWYQKTPEAVKWFLTACITVMCWELFRFGTLSEFWQWWEIMIGKRQFEEIQFTWRYYFDRQMLTLTVIGLLGASFAGGARVRELYRRFSGKKEGYIIQEIALFGLFITAVLCMVNSSYHPFIYFQY